MTMRNFRSSMMVLLLTLAIHIPPAAGETSATPPSGGITPALVHTASAAKGDLKKVMWVVLGVYAALGLYLIRLDFRVSGMERRGREK